MFVVAVCGSLTHYYYLVYLFFLCAVYFVYLVFQDKKKIVPYLVTYALSAVVALKIFPPMIFHMFEDIRGEETIENLNAFSIESFEERFQIFKYLIDNQLFAGCFIKIVIVSVVILLVWIVFLCIDKKKIEYKTNVWIWSIIIVPCICYFALVTQMAVYTDARYMIPIYAMLIIAVSGGLYKLLEKISPKILGRVVICSIGMFLAYSMITKNQCDFRKYPEEWEAHFLEYADNDCIYIHDKSWRMQTSFTEMRKYKSIKFYAEEDFYECSKMDGKKEELLVSVVSECNKKKVIEKVFELYPNLNNYKDLGVFGYSWTLYFYK